MYYLYVLKSKPKGILYFGYTSDLRKRMYEHKSKTLSKFTKSQGPWELVYYEAYRSAKDAQERERQMKKFAKSYAMLKVRIKRSIDKGC